MEVEGLILIYLDAHGLIYLTGSHLPLIYLAWMGNTKKPLHSLLFVSAYMNMPTSPV